MKTTPSRKAKRQLTVLLDPADMERLDNAVREIGNVSKHALAVSALLHGISYLTQMKKDEALRRILQKAHPTPPPE